MIFTKIVNTSLHEKITEIGIYVIQQNSDERYSQKF